MLTRGRYARILNFYLEDYQETSFAHRLEATPTVLPPQVRTLVLFDDRILSRLAEDPGFARLPLPGEKPCDTSVGTPTSKLKSASFPSQ